MTIMPDQDQHIAFDVEELKASLARYPFRRNILKTKHQASVAIILRCDEERPELLMIHRAVKSGDPWSGHMAFPGGKHQPEDDSSLDTAIREAYEEIGLHLKPYQKIGRLSDIVTRHHDRRSLMKITPWVFLLPKGESQPHQLQLNHEAQSYHWLPLSTFDEGKRTQYTWRIRALKRFSLSLNLPSYRYQDKIIWGLSLIMLDEFQHVLEQQGSTTRSLTKKIKQYFQ